MLLGLEAIRTLEEVVADADAIDTAMELGHLHPMGPLSSIDFVGLGVLLAIAEYLYARLGPVHAATAVALEGHLGRTTGQGFHLWR